jgi:hypothetical protein
MVGTIAFIVALAGFVGAALNLLGMMSNPSLEVCLGVGAVGAVVTVLTRRTSN